LKEGKRVRGKMEFTDGMTEEDFNRENFDCGGKSLRGWRWRGSDQEVIEGRRKGNLGFENS
jgi:hypothetical protein